MFRAIPLMTPSVPRVTRKEGIRILTVIRPFTRPTTTPVATAATAPARNPWSPTTTAATSDESATVDPTDRSISADPRAKAIPTAITAMGAACRPMFSRLDPLRNPSSHRKSAKTARIETKAR